MSQNPEDLPAEDPPEGPGPADLALEAARISAVRGAAATLQAMARQGVPLAIEPEELAELIEANAQAQAAAWCEPPQGETP